jgi:hypothetical protein
MAHHFGEEIRPKQRAHDVANTPFWRGNQLVQTKAKELMIWRTKIQARAQGVVELKDSIWFK